MSTGYLPHSLMLAFNQAKDEGKEGGALRVGGMEGGERRKDA